MKNLLTSSFKNNVILKFSILLVMIFLGVSCNENTSKTQPEVEPEVEKISITDSVQVAFAGGGWRAHTAHTGWTLALLNNNSNKLDSVFKKVNTIGSNSGGSWFSTMLMYSPTFVSDIETPGAIKTWGSTTSDGGWLGGQQNIFDAATYPDPKDPIFKTKPCTGLSGDAFVACVFTHYGVLTEWDKLVKKIVFTDYDLGVTTLDGTRTKWATDKSLLLAASMLTNTVVLNKDPSTYDLEYGYYQACPSTSGKAVLDGANGGSCVNGLIPDVTPVSFSSIPKNKGLKNQPFLSAVDTNYKKLTFNVGYSAGFSGAKVKHTTIQDSLSSNDVPVMIAAAASSAAVGFGASKNISGSWNESYLAEDLAINFSLANPKIEHTGAEGMSTKELAENIIVQIADGGAVDNSGVAQLVRFFQQSSKKDGFNIVAFDNVQGLPFHAGVNDAEVGSDIALLFGKGLCIGNEFCSGFNCDGTCISVPELQVFEETPLNSPVTWSYPNKPNKYKNAPKLIYTKYKVTTTANPNFGIKKGSTGTLHAFTCYYPDAPTEPQNEKTTGSSFKAYNEMMQFINEGLNAEGNKGLTYLEKAMGISK